MIYKNKTVDTELVLVIGSITQSERIINEALKMEGEGEQMEMCKALQALEQRGVETGQKMGVETEKKNYLNSKFKRNSPKARVLK